MPLDAVLLYGGWLVAALLFLALIGQFAAGQADVFVSIANPRPLDSDTMVVTLKGWGFAAQSALPFVTADSDFGLADLRVHATRRQVLVSMVTLGFIRPVTVVWRAHAGIQPLGQA